jgi:hypothetical protein
MKINANGVFRPKIENKPTKEDDTKYIPKLTWKKSTMGTLTIYSAENSKYKVRVTVGCFGLATHVEKIGLIKVGESTEYFTFKDVTVEELQVRLEKQISN